MRTSDTERWGVVRAYEGGIGCARKVGSGDRTVQMLLVAIRASLGRAQGSFSPSHMSRITDGQK